ncbi:MAG: zinc-binding dehydrogenase [Candidatus Firestonebacteria bacterium]
MKAIWFLGNKKLEIRDITLPHIKNGEVVVALKRAAICGSDLHQLFKGEKEHSVIPGHELCGVITDNGNSTKLKIGQRVFIYPTRGCENCHFCKIGEPAYCIGYNPGKYVLGFTRNGGYAEKIIVNSDLCLPLPDDIDYDIGCLIMDVFGTTSHSINRVGVKKDEYVGIMGLGPVGLGAALVCKAIGAKVIGIDISKYRIELAKQIGADVVLNPNECDVDKEVLKLTDNYGLNAAIECTGVSSVIEQAIRLLGKGGRLGFLGTGTKKAYFVSEEMILKKLTFMGTLAFKPDEFDAIIALIRKVKDKAHLVITHHFPLEKTAEALDIFEKGNTGKVVLDIEQ